MKWRKIRSKSPGVERSLSQSIKALTWDVNGSTMSDSKGFSINDATRIQMRKHNSWQVCRRNGQFWTRQSQKSRVSKSCGMDFRVPATTLKAINRGLQALDPIT